MFMFCVCLNKALLYMKFKWDLIKDSSMTCAHPSQKIKVLSLPEMMIEVKINIFEQRSLHRKLVGNINFHLIVSASERTYTCHVVLTATIQPMLVTLVQDVILNKYLYYSSVL